MKKQLTITALLLLALAIVPTPAQPQPTASAGGYAYSGSDDIDSVAWYDENSDDTTHEVMTKAPNALGLYDMSGNVSEWCWDWYKEESYNSEYGWQTEEVRGAKGGSWFGLDASCRIDYFGFHAPTYTQDNLGFRVARSAKESLPAPSGFVLVQDGSFIERGEDSMYTVNLDDFYMATHEVTQEEYERVTGNNPSHFARGGSYPVENVSWYDAVRYCNARSKQEGLEPCYYVIDDSSLHRRVDIYTWHDVYFGEGGKDAEIHCDWSANGYRLPTEAEWEYAARGGNR